MECDLSYSRDTFYEQCETRFCGKIVVEISWDQRKVVKRKIYEVDSGK
jgi:hypothetical protein